MSENDSNRRLAKRVTTRRMALIAAAGKSHASYLEDISTSGALLHIADQDLSMFELGEPVELAVDEMTPVPGNVVRVSPPIVAVNFTGINEDDRDRIAAEIMDRAAKFGLVDPDEFAVDSD
ncbi:MAG: PilZ domain-containing protein [Proteobacteria bacterium]|jgi:hypothetical protein|nr:PilZ domain-containing protein [Pseudomonadota bacterium]